jgi:hypothetical protein
VLGLLPLSLEIVLAKVGDTTETRVMAASKKGKLRLNMVITPIERFIVKLVRLS